MVRRVPILFIALWPGPRFLALVSLSYATVDRTSQSVYNQSVLDPKGFQNPSSLWWVFVGPLRRINHDNRR